MTDDIKKNRKSLTDDAIKTRRGVSRRAVLLGTLGAATVAGTAAQAATDSDYGSNADPAGRGYTGYTDNDDGNWADRGGYGRGRTRRGSGITDRDDGSVYDQGGNGRGGTN